MTAFITFFKSVIAGFAMCLPIGPLTIIVIRKTIQYGKHRATIPAVGSLIADIFYSSIAAFGISFIAEFLNKYSHYFQVTAAMILFVISLRILQKPISEFTQKKRGKLSAIKSFSLGFFLVLFNPAVLFFMTTLLTAFNISPDGFYTTGLMIISGLFIGELLWWIFIINLTHWATGKLGKQAPVLINKLSGFILLILSTIIIIKSFIK
ncbi:TPA: hypothetical protein DIC20_05155 [Candidatus Dependentiae bacterium]|nr:MAG: Lysine exporter protein (LYSE/YGGA) [candidate division TM6 bacterium GW2011_GWF2_36_131]KKQ02504.1 MAG: Lysine exporter protein (LYSE/YGGA) [candidate division TM6 bacterium GW2011_GWE2_36_25]KKQ18803.1 MAG: Lysine exporter protein (LYSE/YGGA) [candidate division TM6 bacterium GW2011_GWA2_36_9]HBR70159.1 hypothetical protein [Candidatus Dependentiae bacterium]HCU01059.1 hypothetical protein [Candidatus Dependentiae bacterium]